MDGWLDTGDKVASIVAGVIAVGSAAAAVLWRRGGKEPAPPGEALTGLLRAQALDAARHRYRFFGHVPALTEVYVRQQVTDAAATQRAIGVDAMLASRRHTVLLGGAGAGKSALVAAVVAEEPHGRVLSVSISAADLVGRSLPEALARACEHDLDVTVPAEIFQEPPVRGGRWRVLVDGIDEVVDPDARSRLLWTLHEWLRKPPAAHQLVVTTRPLPDDEMAGLRQEHVDVFELQPFDRDELDTFALRWFRARHPGDPGRAARLAVRFVARVAGARLGPVARVPLLATIAALVFEQDAEGPLPSSRAALYERFADHLLSGRHELRDIAFPTRGGAGKELTAWLSGDFPAALAAALDAAGAAQVRDPDADPVAAAAARWRAASGHDPLTVLPNGRQLIRDLLLATGMLVARAGRIRFTHQSFAEFFAARDGASAFDEAEWRALVANPAARSLAGFMAAPRPDADRLVAGLLDGDADAVAAGDLLADGVPVRDETRRRVVETLIADVSAARGGTEPLRLLRELSVDADVLRRLVDVAAQAPHDWTRVVVADAVADVDPATGVRLLRESQELADPDARDFARRALAERGVSVRPVEWEPEHGGPLSLGPFGRQALSERAADPGIDDRERIDAAIRLADDGDASVLRGLLAAPGITDDSRLRGAVALAVLGDDGGLLALARDERAAEYYVSGRYLRYRALQELHRRRHPAAAELLVSFVDDTEGLPAYGAAAMLAEVGRLGGLIEVAAARGAHPELNIVAARHLAMLAGTRPLEIAMAHVTEPHARAWVAAALVHRGEPMNAHHLIDVARVSPGERAELYALLATGGDERARQWLRAEAGRHGTTAAIALAAIGDAAGFRALDRIATSAARQRRVRVHAAVALGRLGPEPGWQRLRELAAARDVHLRRRAAARLAGATGELDPLLALILDAALPTRHRVWAADVLGHSAEPADRTFLAGAWEGEEYPPLGPGLRIGERGESVHQAPIGIGRHLAPAGVARLESLLEDPATPAPLLIALTNAGLPSDTALDVLERIARDPRRPGRHRVRAAQTLALHDPDRGSAVQRALAADDEFPRLYRWLVLLNQDRYDDDPTWGAFDDHLRRLAKAEAGATWLQLPRLGLLLLRRPTPASATGRRSPR